MSAPLRGLCATASALDRGRCATSSAALGARPAELVALTMTAELSDEFRTKREGVAFVLDAVEAALAGRLAGAHDRRASSSASPRRARRPLDVAAANWVASALRSARAIRTR